MSNNELKPGSWVTCTEDGEKYWLTGFNYEGTPVVIDKYHDCFLKARSVLTPCVEPPKPPKLLVEAWAAINGDGIIMLIRQSEKQAKNYAAECSKPVRVVHLVEATAEDAPRVIEGGLTDFYVYEGERCAALFDSYDDAQAYAKNHNRTVTVMRECDK